MTLVGPRESARLAALLVVAAAAITMSCAPPPPVPPLPERPAGARVAAEPRRCAIPQGTAPFARATPAEVGLDPVGIARALQFANDRRAVSIRIYRHDCLVGTGRFDPIVETAPANIWSSTKGVLSLLVGRAVTQGRIGLDDPVGRYLPAADAAHAAITVRQLLTQSSGLAFSWANDLIANERDSVAYTLALPFAQAPGTAFDYAQTTVTLLAAALKAAVGEDLQDYAQRELFEPIGITRDRWSWQRDAVGNTLGYAFLSLAPADLGRIGALVLRGGRWGDRQLVDAGYVREASTPSPTNGGYGFLWWTNAGDSFVTPTIPARRTLDRPLVRSLPRDTVMFVGFLDQVVIVIPSFDIVVVRTGFPGNVTPDPQAQMTAVPADWMHEFGRLLSASVLDANAADPGPWVPDPAVTNWDTRAIFDPTLP